MRYTIVTLIFAALLPIPALAQADQAGNVTEERVLAEAASGNNWFLKGGNFRGQHFSPLRAISTGTIADLGLAWSANLPVPDGVSATPIVVDGVVYLSGAYSLVFAIDARTGEQLWSYDPGVRKLLAEDPSMSWTARVNRGVAVWQGKVFATTADCRLIALDAESGEELWSKQTCDRALGYAITDAPYVGGDKVFVGNAGSESYEKNRGYVSAYDIDSGDLLWRFYTVPSDNPAENTSAAMKMAARTWSGDALAKFGGGGSNWNEMTYDPETGLLFFGTAGAIPYTFELRSPDGGDNLFLSSVVAIDADTGEYAWHYQTTPQDSWEYNATMNIVLADLDVGENQRKVLFIAPKNGFHYTLDRETGELLAADKFARVNWATHINLETGRPVYDPAAEYWKRPDEAVAVWPNMWGAHSWNAMAYHPGLELVYIPVIDVPTIVTNYENGDFDDTLEMVTEIGGEPFAPGKLVAFDPVAGKPRWTVEHALPFNGGILATAGDLVFQGDAFGRFRAFDAATGDEVWSVKTGSNITAAPVSYALDGEQYVLVPVGAGGGIQFVYPEMHAGDDVRGPTRLMAFTLGGDADMPEINAQPLTLPEQPALQAEAADIETGRELYSFDCKGCHGKNAVARYGGSVPDLRYASMQTHTSWQAIVRGGARRANGMPSFDLSEEEAEDIRLYVLSLSEALRTGEEQ